MLLSLARASTARNAIRSSYFISTSQIWHKRYSTMPPSTLEPMLKEVNSTVAKKNFEQILLKEHLSVIESDSKTGKITFTDEQSGNKYLLAFTSKDRAFLPGASIGDSITVVRVPSQEVFNRCVELDLGLYLNPQARDHPVIQWTPQECKVLHSMFPHVVKQSGKCLVGSPADNLRFPVLEKLLVEFCKNSTIVLGVYLAVMHYESKVFQNQSEEPSDAWKSTYLGHLIVDNQISKDKIQAEVMKLMQKINDEHVYKSMPEKAKEADYAIEIKTILSGTEQNRTLGVPLLIK